MTKTSILAASTLLVFSCSGELNKEEVTHEKTEITIDESAIKLKAQLLNKVKKEADIDLKIALESIIELYNTSSVDTTTNEETIDLYVIYGTAIWEESDEAETFQITLAHQAVENEILFEYRCTFIYHPKEFREIQEFDRRCIKPFDDLEAFIRDVQASPGFKKALRLTPVKIEIEKEEI